MAEEQNAGSNISSLKGYLRETPFFCKIVELLFCVIATGLIINPFNEGMQSNFNHAGVIYVSLCGYIMINAILIFCYLMGEKLGKKTAIAFSGMGAIMCLASGIILIHDHNSENNAITRHPEQYSNQILSSGVLAILTSIIFTVETLFINKYE